MRYVALLRGINVGGKNKVDMATLKETFGRAGCDDVVTYINSGNVVFSDDRDAARLTDILEDTIEEDFGKRHKVLLRDIDSVRKVVDAVPDTWVNDKTMRTRVLFLWEDVDSVEILDQLPVRDGIDEIEYLPGAIVWRVDIENVTKSGQARLAGTKLYKAMTIRNINTVRKVAELMEAPT